ncbi:MULTISPECIES: hypothetical protein [Bacteria]
MARIRRLGETYALVPESGERARLGVVITELARELNGWNAADQRAARRWRIGAPVGALVVAYAIAIPVWFSTGFDLAETGVAPFVVGAIAGVLAVVATEIAEGIIGRRAAAEAREARVRAFRQGKSLESN